MKKLLCLSFCLLLTGKTICQGITNRGGSITLTTDAGLYIKGADTAIYNLAGSDILLKGNVLLDGHLYNNGSLSMDNSTISITKDWRNNNSQLPGSSTIRFTGLTKQKISSTTGSFYKLIVDKSDTLHLLSSMNITNSLQFNAGMIHTGSSNKIDLGSTAQVIGEASGKNVAGTLQAVASNLSGSASFTFGEMGVSIAPNGNNLGTVTINRISGLHTKGKSYFANPDNAEYKSIDRAWDISAPDAVINSEFPVTLSMSWLPENNNGYVDFTQAQVWKSTDQGVNWTSVGPGKDASAYSIEVQTTGFSIWTVSSSVNQPLPVTWVNFTAKIRSQSTALLEWTTATEINNSHFEVERSSDGKNYEKIGNLKGAGNSSTLLKYSFIDYKPLVNKNYYRLKQVDYDGNYKYSQVRYVSFGKEKLHTLMVYPNPFTNTLYFDLVLKLSCSINLEIYDSKGVRVNDPIRQYLSVGNHKLEIASLDKLNNGIYFYKLTGEGINETGKLILTK